jgi:hypothetical protein
MRSFIASMGGPKGGAKASDRALLTHSKPVMELSKDTTHDVVTARATETVAVGGGAEHSKVQSSSSSSFSSSSSSKQKEINPDPVKYPKRKTPLSSSSSSSSSSSLGVSACASVKKSISPQNHSEVKYTVVSSSAVIKLIDAEEEEEEEDDGVLDHSDDIIVQNAKRKKGSVTVKSSGSSDRAVTLVTPECPVSAGDRRAAASASHASRWVCAICTYCHRPEEWQYLQCALCASNRPALSVPSQVC